MSAQDFMAREPANRHTRRTIVKLAAASPIAALLGCANTPAQVQSLVVQYGSVVVSKLAAVLAALPAGTLSADVSTKVNNWLGLATSTVTALGSSTGGQTWLTEAENVIEVVAGVVVPPPWNLAVPLIAALVNAIAGMVGGTAGPTTVKLSSQHLMAARLTPDQIVAELMKIHN